MNPETAFCLVVILIFVVGAIFQFRKQDRKSREISCAIDERRQREEAAEEQRRIYNENYKREEKVLRKYVLDDLRAIERGEKRQLDPEVVEAAKQIMERQGVNNPGMADNYPEIVKPWAALIDDMSAETITDSKAIRDRLADLLYPETLEDVEELKSLQREGFRKISQGENPSPEHLDAANAMNEITAREIRRRREEAEVEESERARIRKQENDLAALAGEMMKGSARNIARIYGLPENSFEGMRPEEVLMHARFLRLSQNFSHLPAEERAASALDALEKELSKEREERGRRTE